MLQKYIVAEVLHYKKDYRFHETILEYDKNISCLILSDDYIKKDIDDNMCHIYSLFQSMINSGIYGSMSSILRAVKNGVIEANLVIVYTSDLDKIYITNGWYAMKDSTSLKDMLKYMSSVQYSYSFKTKIIDRYEIYGDPILGDDIHRSISELVNDLDKTDIITLDSDKVVKTYGLSRELGEYYNNGKTIMTNTPITPWEFHINPPLIENSEFYFQLHDGIRIPTTMHSYSTKCSRISMIAPEYIHCADCSKEKWILTSEERKTLCDLLTTDVWESLKEQYCKLTIFANEDTINKIRNLSMPDYSKLPIKEG